MPIPLCNDHGMTNSSHCLADHGKHRWSYRQDSMLGKLRECQKCGILQQQRGGRYVQIPGGHRPATNAR